MAEVTDRDYAEAEKWTQDCPVCEGMEGALAKQIAAYRESCVAEATTVCVKNWNEQTCRFWIALIEGQLRSIGCKPDIDNETLAAQMARDERDRERAAREKAEGERDEADRASAAFQRAKLAAEARLRDLVEAADRMRDWVPFGSSAAIEYSRVRDAQPPASPEGGKP